MKKDIGLRSRLIASGEKILENQGLDALTLRATAREAGVSHMAPYRHFQDKEALLAAIAEQGFIGLTQALGASKAKGNREGMGVAYVMFAVQHPALYRLMFSAGIKNPEQFPELAKAGDEAYEKCQEAVLEDCGVGNFISEDEVKFKTIALWSLVHGLASLLIDGKIKLAEQSPSLIKKTVMSVLQASDK